MAKYIAACVFRYFFQTLTMCCPDWFHRARHLPLLWCWKVFQVRHWFEKYTNTRPNISAIVPRVSRFTSFSLNQTRPLVLKTVWTDGRLLTQLSNLTSNLSSPVLLTSVDKLVLLSTSSIPLPCVPCYQAVMFSNRTSTDFFSVLQSVSSNFPEHFKRVSQCFAIGLLQCLTINLLRCFSYCVMI